MYINYGIPATVTTMTTQEHAARTERYALVAVFLIATLAIVGLVALVANGPVVPSGVRVVSAQGDVTAGSSDENLAGDLTRPSCPKGGRPPCR